MHDIHGNVLNLGDNVYIMDARVGGSKSMSLLYGKVIGLPTNKTAVVKVFSNGREYRKMSTRIVKPLE